MVRKKKDVPTGVDLARDLVRAHPEAASKTLARRLYKENKERFPSLNAALLAVRKVRGAQGKLHRKDIADKSDFREPQSSGWKPALPPSQAEEWEPYYLNSPCRALILSDAHIPYHDSNALHAAVKHAKKHHKPNVVVINGDWCDFYTISQWQKDPKKRDFVGEVKACRESLAWLRSEFPRAKIVYKVGNHEHRYNIYIWNKAPEIWGLSDVGIDHLLELEKLRMDFVDEERPVMAGKLPIFHGHELPRGLASPVNMARGAFLRMVASMLCGHGHRTSSHAEYNWLKEPIVCWSTGCLCDMHPRFARINKWNWGHAVVEVDAAGIFQVHNYQISMDGDVWST